jgi:hypothetical protein
MDPFTALGIWPYMFTRTLATMITITIYYQYSTTSFVLMDTLYTCALKRTPSWLSVVVFILPTSYFGVGIGMLVCEFVVNQQWGSAVLDFFLVLLFGVNLATYNASGLWLIRILRNHQRTGIAAAGEDLTGSKSASPFDVVISKTKRSMLMLSLPTFVFLILYFYLATNNLNTRPMAVFNPNALPWSTFLTQYAQMILGLIFTRVCWISKTALNAEIMGKGMSTGNSVTSEEGSPSQGTPEQKRTGRAASRADLKERAKRWSQSPKPRRSEGRPSAQDGHTETASAQDSHAEPQTAAVAVTVEDLRPEAQGSVEDLRPEAQGSSEIRPEVQGSSEIRPEVQSSPEIV